MLRLTQVLSVHFYSLLLINMFVIYLTAEARLSILRQRRQTEERYRAFAATVSEGFFQFIFETPLNPSRATREEITAHLLAHTRLAECNGETCRILGVRYPDEILGASIQDLFGAEAEAPVKHFIHEGFRLTSWNHSWASEDGHVRHFVVNVVSTWEGGELSSVLGSFTEVTEQVEKERRMVSLLEEHEGRIGRDLHDETGQILTSIRMLSSTLARRYFKEGDEGYEQAQQVAKFAREIHDSVQNIYRRLIPHSLESDSLAEALETLAFQTDRLPDLNVHFEQEGDYHFADPGIKLQMYRIAQEAVGNAVKHAGASNITISLCRQDQDVVLEVEDDGRGFDVSAATHRTGAIGIYSMHYRARSIQAALQIDSAPGTGTRVRCCVPQVEMLQTVPHGQ